ncbi:MAG: Do family serine endopeptidase [Candidatus Eremiobacteraeota bacterium]|nr:Do family serine endopeptidase [Candidatus Eremiobacteraeota bacterium]MCW5866130.1 Do family serine endopeptidase [Candidatus Eremiobacteraeota bacterium]
MNHSRSGQIQIRTLALGTLTGALLVGLIQTGIQLPAPHPTPARADSGQQIRQEMGTFAKLAKDLKPSVVNIAVEKVVADQQDFTSMFSFPFQMPQPSQPYKRRSHGQGSGAIISPDGYIITNNHVVEGVKSCRVTLSDGSELAGKVVGTDPKTDLALVKVTSPTPLPAAQLGDSEALQVGDWVMAIGNPFGLEATVTVGVLSGKGRVIGAGMYDDFLQTDASINPGNSGGPLFNTSGQIVGINTAIIPNAQGIGFSIPVNMARDIVAQLKDKGHVTRGFLGVGVQPMTNKLKTALGIPLDVHGGLVSSLVDGGPASKAGLQVQDVVTAVNGKLIRSDRELLAEVARAPVGKPADLEIWRGGSKRHLSVTVVERPDDQQVSKVQDLPADDTKTLGVSIRPLTPEIASQLSSTSHDGVVIIDVARNSPAARAGLQRGDIIRKINTTEVHSPEQFVNALKTQSGDSFALLVERQGSTTFLTIES